MTNLSPTLSRRQVIASASALAMTRLLPACAPAPRAAAATGLPAKLGASQPTYYRFALGDFEVTMISDAGAVIDGPFPIVGQDQPPEKVAELMRERWLPEKRFQPGFTPAMVHTGKELVLFDTGNGANGFVPRPDGGWLATGLSAAGFTPEQVTVVVLTHAHPDHVGGMLENGKLLFPNARYVIGAAEHQFWSSYNWQGASPDTNEFRTGKMFQTYIVPFRDRFTLINPGDEAVPGVRAVEAYGHTPGHLGFHLQSGTRQMLIWGDSAHHEVASLARPEWHALFDMDKAGGGVTRRKIYSMAAAERLLVAGYHTSFPSLGYVQPAGEGFNWLPLTYQMRV